MTRFALAAAALMLAGCASEPPPPPVQPATTWHGEWVVTDVLDRGRGSSGVGSATLVGQRLRLDLEEAGDLLGRTCPTPGYRQAEMSEAAFLGAVGRAREYPQLHRPLAVMEVTCGSQPFGLYAQWRDGSLMGRSGTVTVRLARSGDAVVPAPEPPPPAKVAAAPEPKPEPKAEPAAAKAAVAPPAGKLVYLASYRDEKHAHKGWAILKAKSPTLAKLQPATKPVDLGKKGKFIRLFAVTKGEDQGRKLCSEFKKQLPDCGAAGRG
jgi:hypothetical protein